MSIFNETCGLTSRKYVPKTALKVPNLPDKLQYFWSHSSVFALSKQPKK